MRSRSSKLFTALCVATTLCAAPIQVPTAIAEPAVVPTDVREYQAQPKDADCVVAIYLTTGDNPKRLGNTLTMQAGQEVHAKFNLVRGATMNPCGRLVSIKKQWGDPEVQLDSTGGFVVKDTIGYAPGTHRIGFLLTFEDGSTKSYEVKLQVEKKPGDPEVEASLEFFKPLIAVLTLLGIFAFIANWGASMDRMMANHP